MFLIVLSHCETEWTGRLCVSSMAGSAATRGWRSRVTSSDLGIEVWKGMRWMPWQQEAMKDVGACEKPRGAGKHAMIRGCPNGETRRSSDRHCFGRANAGN
jgi:hypothetical protein